MTTPIVAPIRPATDDGDHDRYAHWCRKVDITRANITGQPAIALCGKRWVPNRDPDRYPVCPDCRRIYNEMFGTAS